MSEVLFGGIDVVCKTNISHKVNSFGESNQQDPFLRELIEVYAVK
jgi:hypothetical protein